MIKEKSTTWANISEKLGDIFSKLPFSPNAYTWASFPVALLGMFAIIYKHVAIGIALFSIAGILDLIDGALARNLGRNSHAGAFLDGSLDRFIDFMLLFSYFWLAIQTPWLSISQWICLAIFFTIMPSFEVAYANHRKAVDDPEEKILWRIMNRGEIYILMLLIPLLSLYHATWAGYTLVTLVILSAITTLQTFFATVYLANS